MLSASCISLQAPSAVFCVQEFASHCAPEPPKGPAQMTIAQLREQLQSLGLVTPKGARKGSLVDQLQVICDRVSTASSQRSAG